MLKYLIIAIIAITAILGKFIFLSFTLKSKKRLRNINLRITSPYQSIKNDRLRISL